MILSIQSDIASLMDFISFVTYLFFALLMSSVIIMRCTGKHKDSPRPFKVKYVHVAISADTYYIFHSKRGNMRHPPDIFPPSVHAYSPPRTCVQSVSQSGGFSVLERCLVLYVALFHCLSSHIYAHALAII